MKKLRSVWQSLWVEVDRRVRMGRILGLLFLAVGFVVIGKAWDGAAGQNAVQAQMPYLISGGFLGLGMIITGCTLLFLSTVRGERKILTEQYEEMARLLGRNLNRLSLSTNGHGGSTEQVIASSNAFHRAGCRILEGKDGLMTITVEQASAEGLEACRVCDPPLPPEEPAKEEAAAGETPAQGPAATN